MTPLTLVDLTTGAITLGATGLTAALCFRLRTRAAYLLGAFFACLTVGNLLGTVLFGWHEWLSEDAIRWLRVVEVPGGYLLGPLLYAHSLALTQSSRPLPRHFAVWHGLPAIAALVFSLGNALWAWDTSTLGRQVWLMSMHAWVLQGAPYLLLAAWRIARARPLLEQALADEAVLHLTWLRWLIALICVCWLFSAGDRFLDLGATPAWRWTETAFGVLTTIELYLLAWLGLHQRILFPLDVARVESASSDSTPPRYDRSALDATQCAIIAAELTRLMTHERLYTDSAFDLQALSRRSGWSANYLSQALNQGLQRNFFDFVNGFRVAAAVERLTDPADHRSILDIALSCGFGSKSTFNTVFKRTLGATPSEFRRCRSAESDMAAV